LSLPFKSAGLRSQVESVVSYYDEHGESPPGVFQGALKGEPVGTYGGQGLPAKPLGYYTESDVWASGAGVKRVSDRLVFGHCGEVYFTPTHYDDFVRIR
jgi:guanyl-specific ribonuclease Sa